MSIAPTDSDIGRGVIYREGSFTGAKVEHGIITSLNPKAKVAFVRYSHQHPSADGQATHFSHLEWEHPR